MNDETLGPFVDALASAFAIMVLVFVFFFLQSVTSLTESAKLFTVAEADKDVDRSGSPVIYREPLSVDYNKRELYFFINFEIKPELIKEIKDYALEKEKVVFTIYSKDDRKKSIVNLIRIVRILDLPNNIRIDTKFKDSDTAVSKFTWK